MQTNNPLEQRVYAQRERIPVMYGQVDFSRIPERFAQGPADPHTLPARFAKLRPGLLENRERVAMLRAYTMLGDVVSDAYVARLPEYGAKRLIGMLEQACAQGVDSVANAPPELRAFIAEMERMPAWLDRSLIEEGARRERNSYAHVAPYAIRGAFFATFMNKYSALPMAITGTLSSKTAARRVKETATFFTTSVLPGALERFGEGFRAAAMVRLMHSMVRYNILTKRSDWNVQTHGIPIPQVDQMPAGLIGVFLLAYQVLREGRDSFNARERAIVELSRYRCFLLGLPEELLADTPQGIADLLMTRAATLRGGFDDATCGALVRATMEATVIETDSLAGKIESRMERSFAKLFFLKNFVDGDRRAAARVGIELSPVDYAIAFGTMGVILAQVRAYAAAERIPIVRELADKRLVKKLRALLKRYGHAEYTTHGERYRAPAPQAAVVHSAHAGAATA